MPHCTSGRGKESHAHPSRSHLVRRATSFRIGPLFLFVALATLTGCGGGDEEDSKIQIPGLTPDPMATSQATTARRALSDFLGAMETGDYVGAASHFSGDLKSMRDLNEDVAPDDVAELLSRFCEYHRGACLPAEIVAGAPIGEASFVFTVRYQAPSGGSFETGDPLRVETLRDEFEFRVERIGTRYYVRDLPPRAPR